MATQSSKVPFGGQELPPTVDGQMEVEFDQLDGHVTKLEIEIGCHAHGARAPSLETLLLRDHCQYCDYRVAKLKCITMYVL